MKDKIETTDIYLSAALLALGAKLDNVDKADPRHMRFTIISNKPKFESPVLDKAVQHLPILDLEYYEKEWINGSLLINAVHFKNAIQQMKSAIHSK
jgi:hypothetical protein